MDPQKAAGPADPLRDLHIHAAGGRVPTWVIVEEHDVDSAPSESAHKNLSGREQGTVDRPQREDLLPDQSEPVVQHDEHGSLCFQMAQVLHIVLRDGGRAAEDKVSAGPLPDEPSGYLGQGQDLDRLDLSDSLDGHQVLPGQLVEGREVGRPLPEEPQDLPAQVHRVFFLCSGPEDDREQLRIGQAPRPAGQKPLIGLFLFLKVFDLGYINMIHNLSFLFSGQKRIITFYFKLSADHGQEKNRAGTLQQVFPLLYTPLLRACTCNAAFSDSTMRSIVICYASAERRSTRVLR